MNEGVAIQKSIHVEVSFFGAHYSTVLTHGVVSTKQKVFSSSTYITKKIMQCLPFFRCLIAHMYSCAVEVHRKMHVCPRSDICAK